MAQGVLPFQYVADKSATGRTGFAGLGLYLDLWAAMGLSEVCAASALGRSKRGWPADRIIHALTLVNLSGGESVSDLNVLRRDSGLCKLIKHIDRRSMNRRAYRAFFRRFPNGAPEAFPSDSAVHRFLASAHDAKQEDKRVPSTAFIPTPNEVLEALSRLNVSLVSFVQKHRPQRLATLDEDATLTETHKREALYSYKKFKAYQPLNVYWAEQDLVIRSEFRDGNVPAGYRKLDVLKDALDALPDGVEQVRYRADSAAYNQELLQYLAKGKHPRFGRIEYAVSIKMNESFKAEVAELAEADWKPVVRRFEGDTQSTNQEWAEVSYVPNWAGYSKNDPSYRFIAIREPLKQLGLPLSGDQETAQQQFPFPTMDFGDSGRQTHKLFGVVTNRHLPGGEVLEWHRGRCGASEQVHSEMKRGLAGGRMPSGKFGASAAWWAIMILSLNLNAAMRHLVLGGNWKTRRIKALRFQLIRLPGQVCSHARKLTLKIAAGLTAQLLGRARTAILRLASQANAPPQTA